MKTFKLLAVLLFVIVIYNCNSNEEIIDNNKMINYNSEAINTLKEYSLSITKDIYHNAYDKNYGNI